MNLDKLNVQELSMEEKVNTEGGIWWIIAAIVGFLVAYYADKIFVE
jgi:hypothetical protein